MSKKKHTKKKKKEKRQGVQKFLEKQGRRDISPEVPSVDLFSKAGEFAGSLWIQLFFIAVAVFVVYGHTLNFPFIFDDASSIRENPAIYNLGDFKGIWGFAPLRVVGYLSFALNYHFGQYEVFGYHIVNVLIHILAGLAVLGLGRGLVRAPVVDTISSTAKTWIPILAAMIFVLHPLQTQAVTYIVQRLASLVALFYIASIACYVQSRLHPDKLKKMLWGSGALLLAILAFFTKQNAVTLPLAVFLIEAVFFPGTFKRLLTLLACIGVGLGAVYAIIFFGFDYAPFSLEAMDEFTRETTAVSRGQYLATQTNVLWTYLRLFVWPVGLHLDYDFPLAQGFSDWRVILASLAHLTIIATALRFAKKLPFMAFAICFYYLAHLVESSVIPIRDVLFEHRTYLPNVGLCIASAWLIVFLVNNWKPRITIPLVAILFLALGFATWERNNVWKDPLTLWQDCVEKAPNKARPYNNLGLAYAKQGTLDKAMVNFSKAIQINPKFADAHNNMGLTYAQQGKLNEAVFHYSEALRLKPNLAGVHNNLGLIYYSLGRFDEAIKHISDALRIKPKDAKAHINMGAALYLKGDLEAAATHYSKALTLEPGNAEAYNNLGLIYFAQEKIDDAISNYSKAIQSNPDYADAYKNMGLAFYSQGKLEKAFESYKQALRIKPDYEEARYYLEMTMKEMR